MKAVSIDRDLNTLQLWINLFIEKYSLNKAVNQIEIFDEGETEHFTIIISNHSKTLVIKMKMSRNLNIWFRA